LKEIKSIWLICKYASPEKYFFGTRHFFLSEAWIKNGYDVTIFTSNSSHLTDKLPRFSGSRMIEDINGVKTIWLKVIKSRNSSSFLRILSWIHFELKILMTPKRDISKPDVIIVSSLSILSIISGYIFSRIYKAKFLLEIRDIWPLSAKKLGRFGNHNIFIFLLSALERFGYRNADVIVGTMPNLIEHVGNIERRYKKCVCIPQGITLEQLDSEEKLSEEYIQQTFTKSTFKVVYAGTINVNNPLEVLLEAILKIPDSEMVECYVLGSGSMLDMYRVKFQSCQRIKFIPPIPKNQVKSFIRQTDLCFDSIDSEIAKYGLSRNKWIDYMNAGRPIICSYSGFQSMINESGCGSFVEFGNVELLAKKILEYKNMTKELRTEIGENGRKFLKENRLFPILAKQYEAHFI
jgi:glycosyltransferase involved in cell wall biosynthesis